MNFSAFFKSVQKTAIVIGTGTLVPLALSLTNSTPTGGFAAYLASHQAVAMGFGIAAMVAHNYLSQVQVPVAPGKPVSPVVPPSV